MIVNKASNSKTKSHCGSFVSGFNENVADTLVNTLKC